MIRRQSMPSRWLIIDRRPSAEQWRQLNKLARGNGVLLVVQPGADEGQRLRRIARARHLTLLIEDRKTSARVHNQAELTKALLRHARPILISPVRPTASHPDWKPLPRMRAATLARLAGRKAIALGGMNRQRYAKIALGFVGWAGISAFRT